MSAVYTSGLGTYLWDQVNNSPAGQASGAAAVTSALGSAYATNDPSIDIASISERAQLFSGLEALSRNNPGQFNKNTATIAQYLKSAAGATEDQGQSNYLSLSASSFEQASKTGSFADLFNHEAQTVGTDEPEPYAVSQIYAHMLPQIQNDLVKTSSSSVN